MASRSDTSIHAGPSCPVCFDYYEAQQRRPKMLDCGHTFCEACIADWSAKALSRGYSCPECRTINHRQTGDLPTNFALLSVDESRREPSESPQTPSTRVIMVCGKHQRKAELVCMPCREKLCMICAKDISKQHAGHDIEAVKDALSQDRREVETLTKALTEANSRLLEQHTAKMGQFESSRESVCQEINQGADAAIEEINEQRRQSLHYVQTVARESAAVLEQKLQVELTQVNDCLFLLSEQLKSHDDGNLCDMRRVRSSVEGLRKQLLAFDTSQHLPVFNIGKTSVQFGKVESLKARHAQSTPQPINRQTYDSYGERLACNIKSSDNMYSKPLRDAKAYLKALAEENNVYPKHWTKYTTRGKEIWQKWLNLNNTHRPDSYLVTVDAKTKHAVEQLMQKTWDQQFVGHGADATGLGAVQGIQVTRVQRIENPELYRDYYEQLKQMCEKGSRQSYNKIFDRNIGEPEVRTATFGVEIDATRVPEINEYFLFHGIKNAFKDHIVMQGLDTRMAGDDLFGRGTYFAESSTKADQYSDKKNARSTAGTELIMVVARVLLGNVWHQKGEMKCYRPPCAVRHCHKCDCHHQERFDSMLGTHKSAGRSGPPIMPLNFREFVTYDPHRAYPEFIVTYKRL